MKIFEGFQNKIVLGAGAASGWLTKSISGLDPDTKLVSVEACSIFGTTGGDFGSRPVGTTSGTAPYIFFHFSDGHVSSIVPVNELQQIQLRSPAPGATAVVTFSVTGQWGGPAVIVPTPTNYATATGLTPENKQTYREFDLKNAVGWTIPSEHQGNIEAVICSLNTIEQDREVSCRSVGSTWTDAQFPNKISSDTIIKVDDDDRIEVLEDSSKSDVQESFVRFIGYILRGNYNDGTGAIYKYNAVHDPVEDGTDSGGAEADLDMRPLTSPNAVAVYWQWQTQRTSTPSSVGDTREKESIDPFEDLRFNFNHYVSKPVNLIGGVLEFQKNASDPTTSEIFGWLERVRRRRIIIV